MNSKTKPKQFLSLHGRPIIIHTLEHFQRHPLVDNIAIVCVSGWEEELKQEISKNLITKVKWVVSGGDTVQLSTYNALKAVYEECESPEDTIAIVHDGVRPLIDQKLITDNINMVKSHGSSITVSYATETICAADDQGMITKVEDRNKARIGKAPQCFYLDELMEAHLKAQREGINWMIDSSSLMNYYGKELYTVLGSTYNVKITSPADYFIFRALFEAEENSQIFGL